MNVTKASKQLVEIPMILKNRIRQLSTTRKNSGIAQATQKAIIIELIEKGLQALEASTEAN